MRIVIAGVGGVGGHLALRLIEAGRPPALLARGDHLAALKARGLEFRAPGRTAIAPIGAASDDPRDLGLADLVIVAVKAQHLDSLDLAPLIGPGTVLLPFLNGVEATRTLDARYGAGRTLVGVARISAFIEAPGVVAQHSEFARFEIGAAPPAREAAAREAVATLSAAGVEASFAADPLRALWRKFLLLAPFSGVTAAARCDAEAVRTDPLLARLFRTLAEETAAVGRAEGAALTAADVEDMVANLATMPPRMRSSMANDLATGRPLEVDWLAGAVSRLGAARGVPTPASDAVWAALRPFRHGV